LRHVGADYPLVTVFAGSAAAVLAYEHQWGCLAFTVSILALVLSRSRLVHAAVGVALGLAACLAAPGWLDVGEGVHRVLGRVSSLDYPGSSPRVTIERLVVDGARVRGSARVLLSGDAPEILEGDVITADIVAMPPKGFGNEGEFDLRRHLLETGVVLDARLAPGGSARVIGTGRKEGLRNRMIRMLEGFSRPEAELIKAMVLGDRSGITPGIRDSFEGLGVSHLLAISGLHIGIALMIGYASASLLLRMAAIFFPALDTPMIARLAAAAWAVWYTVFAGAGVTVMRACIMAVCVAAGTTFLKRKTDVLEGLALAGVIILVVWPGSLSSASFLLSFSAVFGIASALRASQGCPLWFRSLAVSLAPGVFTLPLVIRLFGFVSLVGFAANLVVVPLFGLFIMPCSAAGLAASLVCEPLGSFLLGLSMDTLGLIVSAGQVLGRAQAVPVPSVPWVCACFAGFIIAFWGRPKSFRTLVLSLLCMVIAAIPLAGSMSRARSPMQFDFISVGQGDSILVTQGRHAMLIDAGPSRPGFDAGRYVVGPHLARRGYVWLDLVVVTHLHPDHAGGVPFILSRFPVGRVWVNSWKDGNPSFMEIQGIARKRHLLLHSARRGDTYRLGSASVRVLAPLPGLEGHSTKVDQNVQSIVLMVTDGRTRGLFMGDADMFGELVQVHLQTDLKADVLKVAHHGGKHSCLDPFLEAVRPDVAVISCGRGNPHGDPSPQALERLEKRNIRVFRTDIHGEVLLRSCPRGLSIKSARNPADTQ